MLTSSFRSRSYPKAEPCSTFVPNLVTSVTAAPARTPVRRGELTRGELELLQGFRGECQQRAAVVVSRLSAPSTFIATFPPRDHENAACIPPSSFPKTARLRSEL